MNYKLRIEVIKEIYNRYNLSKQQNVPDLLKKYAGSEDKLLDSICSKYNISSYELSSIVLLCEERVNEAKKSKRAVYLLGFLCLIVLIAVVFWFYNRGSTNLVEDSKDENNITVTSVAVSGSDNLQEQTENGYYSIKLPEPFKCVNQEFNISSTYTDGEITITLYPWGHDGVDKKDLVSLIEQNLETISLKKTNYGLFWGTGRTSDGIYRYVVILPDELLEFQLYSKTNDNKFSEYSQWLLKNVREAVRRKNEILLTDWRGETCYNMYKE